MLVRLRILWLNLLALAGAISAIVPLLATRRPQAVRRHVPEPRVVALPQRRRASPR